MKHHEIDLRWMKKSIAFEVMSEIDGEIFSLAMFKAENAETLNYLGVQTHTLISVHSQTFFYCSEDRNRKEIVFLHIKRRFGGGSDWRGSAKG